MNRNFANVPGVVMFGKILFEQYNVTVRIHPQRNIKL